MSFYNKIIKSIVMIVVLFVSFSIFSPSAYALEQKIFDEAGLLTENERRELEELATTIGDKWNIDIIIVTTNDAGGMSAQRYMEIFYEDKIVEQGLKKWNASVLAVDMGRRDYSIGNFYKAKFHIEGERVDGVLDGIWPYMRDGDYLKAFEKYILLTDYYMGKGPVNPIFHWWVQLIIAAVVGAVAVLVMAYNSGGRVTVSDRTYMNTSTSRVLSRKDKYIRTTITKTHRPKSSGGGGGFGGGGGGGRTSGGHSYSGGSRRF